MGRPSKFTDAISERIMSLAREGKTDREIARAIGVTERTLNYWKVNNADFFQSLRENKSVADQLVIASLFQRACGYSHVAVKMFYDKDRGTVIKEKYIEHYPPDPTCMIFWLKNRDSENWKDTPENKGDDEEIPQPIYTVINGNPTDGSAK